MMSKKSRANPRMLTNVLQAVADLKDINGSTPRKILDQVQTAINVSNIKPKPRNVVMQVRKALKHAVETGVLKQRAGKYRLALGQDTTTQRKRPTRKCRRAKCEKSKTNSRNLYRNRCSSNRKCRKPDRKKHAQKGRRKRKPCRRHASITTSPSMYSSYYDDDSRSLTSLRTDSDYYYKGRKQKQRKSKAPKEQKTRPAKLDTRRKQTRGNKRHARQPTPIPMPTDNKSIEELDYDSQIVPSSDRTRDVNRYQDEFPTQGLDSYNQCEYHHQHDLNMPPECDNPDCLCNLKQEPYDDNNYDDMNDGGGYMDMA